MPDMNMRVYDELQRHQLVTEFDIQSQSELDDYQVKLDNIDNPTQAQDNLVIDSDGIVMPHWNESVDFDTWVKIKIGVSGKRGLLIHGNGKLDNGSDGNNTFIAFHGFADANYLDSLLVTVDDFIYESRTRYTFSGNNYVYFGLSDNTLPWTNDGGWYDMNTIVNRHICHDAGVASVTTTKSPLPTINQWYDFKIIKVGSTSYAYRDGAAFSAQITSGVPTISSVGLFMNEYDTSQGEQNYAFVRQYIATEPTIRISIPKNIAIALKTFGRAG